MPFKVDKFENAVCGTVKTEIFENNDTCLDM